MYKPRGGCGDGCWWVVAAAVGGSDGSKQSLFYKFIKHHILRLHKCINSCKVKNEFGRNPLNSDKL